MWRRNRNGGFEICRRGCTMPSLFDLVPGRGIVLMRVRLACMNVETIVER